MTAPAAAPAQVYDDRFVPSVFGPWGTRLAALLDVGPGMAVLDVGCGTGAFATAAARAGAEVTGVDPNPEMLAVARGKPGVTWVDGAAEDLPFEDDRFDAVGSQFAAMFFEDRARALRQMARVAKPGAPVAVAVCDDVTASGAYGDLATLLDRLFGTEVGDAFRAPFVLGDPERLLAVAHQAGLDAATVERHASAARFDSIADLIATERACAWTLGGMLDDDQFARLAEEAEAALRPYAGPDGVRFDMPALVLRFAA